MTSKATGSRTILHHRQAQRLAASPHCNTCTPHLILHHNTTRDLRELSCSDFFRQVCTSKDCTDDEVAAALRQWSWYDVAVASVCCAAAVTLALTAPFGLFAGFTLRGATLQTRLRYCSAYDVCVHKHVA